MKAAKTNTILMGILLFSVMAIPGFPVETAESGTDELEVVCSPGLESLANQLADDFMKQNSDIGISVKPIQDLQIIRAVQQGAIALVNKNCLTGSEAEDCFKLVVGREAMIPIMNAAHPQRDLMLKQGISPEAFARIYNGQSLVTWGEILGTSNENKVNAYAPAGSCAKEYLAEFMSIEPGKLNERGSLETEEMLLRIAEDPYALGFCSLACLMNQEEVSGIQLIPVDADGDGQIGTFENIYTSSSMLSHSIYVGRFPRSLFSPIYALSKEPPASTGELAFMEWLVNDGQEVLALAGILELGYGERNSRMEQLSGQQQAVVSVSVQASPARVYLLVAGVFILLAFLVYLFTWMTGSRVLTSEEALDQREGSVAFPGGVFFDRSHTWAFMEKSGRVRIGMDDFLLSVSGPVSRVVMKQPGEQIKRGEPCITLIQDGKRLEINSPLSGIIREQNEELLEDVSLLNSDPYASGWILMVEPVNWISELKSYVMGQSYNDWLKQEVARLKAFFASVLKLEHSPDSELVLQDGGELKAGILESFGPEVWEEFQEGFINARN